MSWYSWLTGADAEAGGAAASGSAPGAPRPVLQTERAEELRRRGRTDRQELPGRATPGGDPFLEPCERVMVRVYDLGTTVLTHPHNVISRSYGAFHTGVEVYGREWSFGMSEDWRTGVTWCPPGRNPDHTFRETLAMGYTKCSFADFTQILNEMKQDWRGTTYSLLTRNCHHFSDALCRRLGVGALPPWINDLAGVGDATASAFDKVYNTVSISDALSTVTSGLYLTVAGVPECIRGRRRPEHPAPGLPEEDSDDPDDPHGPVGRDLRELPPARGDLVYPARGEAVMVYHTMGSGGQAGRRGMDDSRSFPSERFPQ